MKQFSRAMACFVLLGSSALPSRAGPIEQARHVILMISDGQGFGAVMGADFYSGERAAYEAFPVKRFMTTYPLEGDYNPDRDWRCFSRHLQHPTDSAAASTAMARGVNAENGNVSATDDVLS